MKILKRPISTKLRLFDIRTTKCEHNHSLGQRVGLCETGQLLLKNCNICP